MSDYEDVNRSLWNDWADLHVDSTFYDVESFRAGASSLHSIEREAVGDVAGKRLLHLQCHFGMDTLSWARLGAVATGVDFSPRAIDLARRLSAETGIEARFLESAVYDLPDQLDETFDIVFTSWGVLPWLPDLGRWARVVARFLDPGGVLHLVEFHPIADVFDATGHSFAYPYFAGGPIVEQVEGSYAVPDEGGRRREVTFAHTLGAVVTAVAEAGLAVERLEEFPWSPHGLAPWQTQSPDGQWVPRAGRGSLPLTYALRARRPPEPRRVEAVSPTGET